LRVLFAENYDREPKHNENVKQGTLWNTDKPTEDRRRRCREEWGKRVNKWVRWEGGKEGRWTYLMERVEQRWIPRTMTGQPAAEPLNKCLSRSRCAELALRLRLLVDIPMGQPGTV
jgi:hypothetical protein